jgi:mono/diheme cytochrome c family protein
MLRFPAARCVPLLVLAAVAAEPAPPGPAAVKFFEDRVRPILADRCLSCHGSEKPKGGLRLDSLAALLQGGDRGPAIVPGKPEDSLLIQAIRHGEALQMPPKAKLPPQEIADLAAWVKSGAPWPDATTAVRAAAVEGRGFTEEERSFWAFQKAVALAGPAVRDGAWVKSPLDRFILAKLEANGLRPAPPADRRTLIRRVYFDLTGLPPTPEAVEAFVRDESPDAFAKVIDSLLASPRYGERWGRHWLDVARYADSNGMDENLAMGNAWHYRDYVIAAFNNDKPYDLFLKEQLAGDLLPPGDPDRSAEHLMATGFLCIGPKMLAEDDPVKMEMDIIDEQVDTVGRAFLGLTLGCARCHDHKFDPISQADYYSLAGIFKSTKTMVHFKVVARWQELPAGPLEAVERLRCHQEAVTEKQAEIAALSRCGLNAPAEALGRAYDELATLRKTRPDVPEVMAVSDGKPTNLRIHLRGSHLTLGREVPRQFPRILTGDKQPPFDERQSGRLQLAEWLTQPDHPLTSRVLVNRVWRWHFGEGLVHSTDNFGKLGDRPSHPELLDWLAVRFVEGGWSIKALHRLILLSNTYQMSTTYDERAARADPENRLHWRHDRRRLDAEELRDGILAVGGKLDLTMGGSLYPGANRAYVLGYPNATYDKYDFNRRSVYLPVIRSDVYAVLQAFDFPDPSVPSGERATTTVAPQALFLMNGKLVAENTRHLAEALLADAKLDDAGRVRVAYERAYSRPPTTREAARALDFVRRCEEALTTEKLDEAERRLRAWQSLCRVVLAANEFIYVE